MGSYWKGRTVFVTGATGLMGGWVVKALLRDGAEIVALVRDYAPKSMVVREGVIERIATLPGDLESLPTMQRAISEYGRTPSSILRRSHWCRWPSAIRWEHFAPT